MRVALRRVGCLAYRRSPYLSRILRAATSTHLCSAAALFPNLTPQHILN